MNDTKKILNVALIAFIDSEGKVLMNRRADAASEMWELLGGGIEAGETPLAAITREILEEIGYDISTPTNKLQQVDSFTFENERIVAQVHLFTAAYPGMEQFSDSDEVKVADLKTYKLEDARALPLLPITQYILNLHGHLFTVYPTSMDRSDLAARYPVAKSYEERVEDDKAIKRTGRLRLPRYPRVTLALYGVVAPVLFTLFLQTMSNAWLSGTDTVEVLTRVSLSMLLAVAVLGLFWAWVKYVYQIFSYFGGTPKLFWAVYGIVSVGLYMLMLGQLLGSYTSLAWLPAMGVLHFGIIYGLLVRTLDPEDSLA